MDPRHPADASRILVVDDDVALTATLAQVLGGSGYIVDVAHNGREALQRARAQLPALVLLDVQMPIMDGYEFLDAFREVAAWSEIPIVLETGGADMIEARRRSEGKGVVVLMPKPLDLETLLTAIESLVSSRGAQE
jgi:two-component system, chemotaxis family, chemotaxis protein CheY